MTEEALPLRWSAAEGRGGPQTKASQMVARITFYGGPKDGDVMQVVAPLPAVGYFYSLGRKKAGDVLVRQPAPGKPAHKYRRESHKNAAGEAVYYYVGIETITKVERL